MDLTIYMEVFILGFVLTGNVFGNNFIGHIPTTAAEVSARPTLRYLRLETAASVDT
jgi:hypothetical protein